MNWIKTWLAMTVLLLMPEVQFPATAGNAQVSPTGTNPRFSYNNRRKKGLYLVSSWANMWVVHSYG